CHHSCSSPCSSLLPYAPLFRSGTADVYRHAMPGGQYSNLREQARAMGLTRQWPEIAQAYADVNKLFGNIIKVTPTSKVVGDLARSEEHTSELQSRFDTVCRLLL